MRTIKLHTHHKHQQTFQTTCIRIINQLAYLPHTHQVSAQRLSGVACCLDFVLLGWVGVKIHVFFFVFRGVKEDAVAVAMQRVLNAPLCCAFCNYLEAFSVASSASYLYILSRALSVFVSRKDFSAVIYTCSRKQVSSDLIL